MARGLGEAGGDDLLCQRNMDTGPSDELMMGFMRMVAFAELPCENPIAS